MAKRRTEKLANSILREINEIISRLVEIGFVDNQNFPSVDFGVNDVWRVSYSHSQLNLSLKSKPYEDIYLEMAATSSYSILLLDGALVQISYEGIADKITRHRLAYFPSPRLRPYQDDPELYFQEQLFIDIVGHQVVPIPIRFDFDSRPGVAVDTLHPTSHVTLGQYRHCRIPATSAVSPRMFIEFIMHSFYSTPDTPRVALTSRLAKLSDTISARERANIHFGIG